MQRTSTATVLLFALALVLPVTAMAANGHTDFASKSSAGSLDQTACLSHGGQLVSGNHLNLVMQMGRRDDWMDNIIHLGDTPYVTYTIASSSFFGTSYKRAVCQF
jgi:hypothetical protein